MAVIGIDLGTTNSLACVFRKGRAELIPNGLGAYQTRSAVSLLEDGTVLTGAAAAERLVTHPETSAASFKVWMGTERTVRLGERDFTPEELSAFVLRQLKADAERYLGEEVREAVISVPAYFNDNQRCATKLAAQLAGLTVERLINEPSAAALYHRQAAGSGDGQMMVVDFGGGTLDVSLVECFENIIEITAIAGDNRLGGNDIDQAVARRFCQENGLVLEELPPAAQASLLGQAETVKRVLSAAPAAVMALQTETGRWSFTLTRPLLRELCAPVFRRVGEVIRRALQNHGRESRVDQVVLVGGSAQMPVFGDFLEELFGRRPAVAAQPGETVALGVGLCAGIKERAQDLRDLVMTDVCPFSLGVATYSHARDKTPHMAFLIPRSSMLPASHQQTFYTLFHNQRALRFEIYQGEGYYASENLKLGELEVQVPPGPPGEQSACVTFTYDIDGVLHVSARSSGGDYRDRLILNPRLRLSGEALEQARARLEEVRLAARNEGDRLLTERALRLYEELPPTRRDEAAWLLQRFQIAEEGDRIEREKARRALAEGLDRLEEWLHRDPFGFWPEEE
ncbi:MAG: Hsp70 family protein [Oscillibacter sp.]|nr:Hsp70 family protein [Oscillibacter sp.]